MRLSYDLHIHSCLSPCGDEDMTPNNIAGMGVVAKLDIMALTDHNTCLNCPAFFKTAEANGIIPVAGMELTTAEDIHVVCLFPTLQQAMEFDSFVSKNRIRIRNKPEVFGHQYLMDADETILGEEPDLLINATMLSLEDAFLQCETHGGICYPAHIDRDSLSILSVLGEIDPYCGFVTAELADSSKLPELRQRHPILNSMNIVTNSDAHYLENMRDAANALELERLDAPSVIAALDNNGKIP